MADGAARYATGYALLLRAVNVGGRRLEMRDLRAICADVGCDDVRTYLQSGNAVFRSTLSEAPLATELEQRLAERVGFPVPAILRTDAELASVVERCPFDTAVDPTTLVVAFARTVPEPSLGRLDAAAFDEERLALDGRELYMLLPGGQGRSRLAAAVARTPFGAASTIRNWRTVLALRDLTSEVAGS